MTESDSHNHGERITAVESEVRALTANVNQLTNLVREGHEATRIEIQKLGQQIASIGKANWPTIFGGILLILSLGTAALGPTWLRIGAIEVTLKEQKDAQVIHALLPIHPVAAEEVKMINWRLDHLEHEQQTKGTK